MRWLWIAVVLAGCIDDVDSSGPSTVTVEKTCSAEIQEASRPEGQPWGTLNHSIQNGLAVPLAVQVAHLHETGCSLGTFNATLAPGAVLELTYEDTMWDTAERVIRWGEQEERRGVDWACTWDVRITTRGLEDVNEYAICA